MTKDLKTESRAFLVGVKEVMAAVACGASPVYVSPVDNSTLMASIKMADGTVFNVSLRIKNPPGSM